MHCVDALLPTPKMAPTTPCHSEDKIMSGEMYVRHRVIKSALILTVASCACSAGLRMTLFSGGLMKAHVVAQFSKVKQCLT